MPSNPISLTAVQNPDGSLTYVGTPTNLVNSYTWGPAPTLPVNPTPPQPTALPHTELSPHGRQVWIQWIKAKFDSGLSTNTVWEDYIVATSQANLASNLIHEIWQQYCNVFETHALGKEPKSKKHFLEKTFREAFSYIRMPKVSGEIGIEIEAEGRDLFTSPIQYWMAINDHSLRNVDGHPPIEYVLREPINRSDVLPALDYLGTKLKQCGSKVVMSHRCSVHVHINVQDMPMLHLMNYISLYYILEDILIEWSGPERKGNLFCLRAKDADFQIELLVDALKQGHWHNAFSQEYRYAAMNAASLGKHGSLEFRSMRGNVEMDFIAKWVSILTHLKDISNTYKNPEHISDEFRRLGPYNFFQSVIGNFIRASDFSDIHGTVWESYRSMRDLAHAIDWENPPMHMGTVEEKQPMVELDIDGDEEDFEEHNED